VPSAESKPNRRLAQTPLQPPQFEKSISQKSL